MLRKLLLLLLTLSIVACSGGGGGGSKTSGGDTDTTPITPPSGGSEDGGTGDGGDDDTTPVTPPGGGSGDGGTGDGGDDDTTPVTPPGGGSGDGGTGDGGDDGEDGETPETYTATGFIYPQFLESDPLSNTVTVTATDFSTCLDSNNQVVSKANCSMPSPAPTHEMFVYVMENTSLVDTVVGYSFIYFQQKTENEDEAITVTLPELAPGQKVYGLLSNSLYHVDFVDIETEECLLSEVRALPSTPINLSGAFKGCTNITSVPANVIVEGPMENTFAYTTLNDPNISTWDVSGVDDMEGLFRDNPNFNQPLNHWDVSNVKNFRTTFHGTSSFNQPLNNWDVSKAEDLAWMFFMATGFNQDISNWNINPNADVTEFADHSGLSYENLPDLP